VWLLRWFTVQDLSLRQVDAIPMKCMFVACCLQGRSLPWLVGVVAALAHYGGIYHVVEVADRAITNDAIARFEEALDAHIRTS
jgi:hypothetical protein